MPRSIRIAHVNVARGYRGGERQTELLIRELAGLGFSQVLVCRRRNLLKERVADLDVVVRFSSGNPLSTFVRTGGVDVVHVHEGRSVYAGYLRSLVSGTPYVITRRVDNPIGEHVFAHKAYRRAACVAAVAPAVEESIQRFDPAIRTTQILSSSSCLRTDDVTVKALRERFAGKFVVGHVGALDNHQKGQEYILEAAASIEESHPDIHFMLVGEGEDRVRLQEFVAARGLGNVTFTGFVDNVGDYLAAFDLFVLPSNFEALGSILLDAMAQGLPVVGTRVGGIPTLVRDEETGLLVEPRRSDQLVSAILRLHDDAALMCRLGHAARALASDFTPDAMCRRYVSVYESILR